MGGLLCFITRMSGWIAMFCYENEWVDCYGSLRELVGGWLSESAACPTFKPLLQLTGTQSVHVYSY